MKFRFARHSSKIDSLIYFYTSILQFEVLGKFENHDGYNGVFLGKENASWELEFTESKRKSTAVFDKDDYLVFYPDNETEYKDIMQNIEQYKVPILTPENPYWQKNGICIEDCDHYKIIIAKI